MVPASHPCDAQNAFAVSESMQAWVFRTLAPMAAEQAR